MAIGDIIVGVDIGTSKVCTVVGEVNNFGQIEIIANTSYKCSGLKKGKIINEEEVILSLAKTIKDAEDETNLKINSAYVTIPGKYVTIVQNSITKDVKDKYSGISIRDVQTAIMQVKDIEIPEGETLIDIVPDKITLENGTVVSDPVGNLSSSFTISAQVILAERDYVRQLNNIFRKVGLEIDGIVPITLAERNLILDKNELHDNIMLLDIGAGNTDIGVFEGTTFLYTNSIPLGGDNITNDIALVLNISEEEADKLKRQYGLALKSFIDNDNDIILNTCKDNNKNKIIKSSELIEIIEARIEEMFSIINKDITNQGLKQKINNVVLTGQGIININDAKLTSSKVMVVAQNDGTLTELLVNDGDKVEAGQVIAKMKVVVTPEQIEALQKAYDEAKVNYDNLEQQVKASMVVSQPVVTSSSTGNVAAAQARLDAAAANKQKMDKLYSIGAVSATQYAEAQSEYAAAQSALAAASTPQVVEQQASVSSAPSKELSEALATAQIQLNQAKAALDQAQSDDNFADITAPVSGIIYLTDFKQGDELKQGDVFINVGNTKNLWVEAPLTEEQYAKVRQGQFVHYSVDDMDLTGTVLEVTHQDSEDEENKNLVTAAKISFPDELKDKVLPGADVTVQITIDR